MGDLAEYYWEKRRSQQTRLATNVINANRSGSLMLEDGSLVPREAVAPIESPDAKRAGYKWIVCDRCGGSGVLMREDTTCYSCDGTGVLLYGAVLVYPDYMRQRRRVLARYGRIPESIRDFWRK
jgi:hypothetical protein